MSSHEPGAGSQSVPPPTQQPPSIAPDQPQAPEVKQTPKAKKGRNALALVAFIASIVGFIFACIPGALIVGWILLPIAFILAIVSLFLKGTGKGLGIAGLIISVVGTIVAVVVFLSVLATSFEDAFGSGDVTVESAEDGQAPADAPEGDAAAAEGTRENPVVVGSTISSNDWTAVVNSYAADGNPIVLAGPYNEPAPAGSHYEVVNYTVTYTGEESAYAVEVTVDLVTSAGNVVNSFDTFVILDDALGIDDELFNGASATGSAAFVVPDGETVLIRLRPGTLADEVFVKP